MIININSGSSGWGNYVLYGTKDKPRDNSKVELLDGDISLGDYYSKNNKYEDSYYTVVLGFKGKPSKEVIEGAYNDFKEHFFKGLSEDEYHIDAVIHYDTDDTHIHARIPKQNLLTNTHLQLYYDKIDRPRKELIQDYISLKYGFEIARETNKEIVKEQSHEYINKWREERNQEPFDFSKKKGKDQAEKQINSYISDLITSNMIEKQEDIRTVLEELDLEVIKFDRDIKKDFAYVTVQNGTGKMRVKGEFYDGEFFSYNAKDRTAQIESNRRIKEHTEPTHERFARVQQQLRKANEKRYNRVTELFRASRERANKQIEATTSKAIEINRQSVGRELGNNREPNKSTPSQNISNSSNIRDNNRDNINDNDKTLFNTEREQHDRSREDNAIRKRSERATSNENSKQAINTRTSSVASTTEPTKRRPVREVYQSRVKEDIQRRGNTVQVGSDKGVQVNDTSRATTYERDRESRRERAETLREARRTRIELYKSITTTANSIRKQHHGDSQQLRDKPLEDSGKLREQFIEKYGRVAEHSNKTRNEYNEYFESNKTSFRFRHYFWNNWRELSRAVTELEKSSMGLTKRAKRIADELTQYYHENVSISNLNTQQKIFLKSYNTLPSSSNLKSFFISKEKDHVKLISYKQKVHIKDYGDKITASNTTNQDLLAKMMIDIAEAKGWDLNQLNIKGSDKFKEVAQLEIDKRIELQRQKAQEIRRNQSSGYTRQR